MEEILWEQKYRPKTIDDCILPKHIKDDMYENVKSGIIENQLFIGKSGTGKTTTAFALGQVMKYDTLYVNASNEGRSIDTLRGLLTDFCSTMSLVADRKLVILDEFDGVGSIVQDALRAFVEQYSKTTSFILTANNKYKLSAAINSRFSEVKFSIPEEEKKALMVSMMKRIVEILKAESVEFDNMAVKGIVEKYFPDFRKTLIELQIASKSGKFTLEQLKDTDTSIAEIIHLLKNKSFGDMIKSVEKTPSIDFSHICEELWENVDKFVDKNSKAVLVKILSEYIDKSVRTANPKITLMAMYADIMTSVDFV